MTENMSNPAPEREAGPLEPKAILASAHRVWATTWSAAGYGARALAELTAEQRLEYLARAALTDAIALVCDGAACGLLEHAKGSLRSVGDPESAQAIHDLDMLQRADRGQVFPMSLEARHGRAIAVLSQLDTRNVSVKETLNEILKGKASELDCERLARLLATEELLPPGIVAAAFDAARELCSR